jgi:hypothetical protein
MAVFLTMVVCLNEGRGSGITSVIKYQLNTHANNVEKSNCKRIFK